MDKDHKRLLRQLLGINATIAACPIVLGESKACSELFPILGGFMLLVPLPLFVLSFGALMWTVRHGVVFYRMTKMEAWWWLSGPYSVALPLAIMVLQLQQSITHVLAPFLVVAFLTALSCAAWAFVTLYQVVASRSADLTVGRKVMLGLVLFAALLWLALLGGQGLWAR